MSYQIKPSHNYELNKTLYPIFINCFLPYVYKTLIKVK